MHVNYFDRRVQASRDNRSSTRAVPQPVRQDYLIAALIRAKLSTSYAARVSSATQLSTATK